MLWRSATARISQPLTNACRRCCQIVPVGRASLRMDSGSFEHAICIARCPAELVVNGLPSAIGSPHNSQHSVELLCCAAVNSAAGTVQFCVGPRRVRHSKPEFLGVASVVIANLHLISRFHIGLKARQCPNLEDETRDINFGSSNHPGAGVPPAGRNSDPQSRGATFRSSEFRALSSHEKNV